MSDTVIKVENLNKSAPRGLPISHQNGERYTALRDVLTNGVKAFGNRVLHRNHGSRNTQHESREEFWALNDVSFEVKQGERVGREPPGRGRNGAAPVPKGTPPPSTLASTGLSTRLKILSRIPSPTKGRVHIKGRVASLLEVARPKGPRRRGRGFHPELTGRETIYLNGAILGMSREGIQRNVTEMTTNDRKVSK